MKIAYLTNCFGTQSHTFMRREIRALEKAGLSLVLYGIHKDTEATAEDAQDLVRQTTYLYPLNAIKTLKANAHYFMSSPLQYVRGGVRAFSSREFSLKRRAKMAFHYLAAAPLAREMSQLGVTHIHAHFLNVSASIAMFAAEHSKIPFSITIHSAGSYKAIDTIGLHQKLRSAQFLIMISQYNVAYYNAIVPCQFKSHVVRCGMDLVDFTFRFPLDPESVVCKDEAPKVKLLAVARFVAKKGLRYLIEAAALLKQRQIDFELKIIGTGPLEAELKSQVNELGLQGDVLFEGQKSTADVRAAMTSSDIVIVPSITTDNGDMEGLPVVIMEAMACGTTVVASNHAGIPEIVIPGETGELTEERNPASIADAIVKLTNKPSDEIRIRARQLVEAQFNIDVVAQQRLELFQNYHRG